MSEPALPIPAERERYTAAKSSCSRPLFLSFVAWCAMAAWRTCVDWRAKRPFLTRATAHLSVIALTLITIFVSGVGIPAPRAAVGGSFEAGGVPLLGMGSSTEGGSSPTPAVSNSWPHPPGADTVARMPVPHTTFPDRLRTQVETHVVQLGDTVFDIAARFGLSPETIVWSNREAINDAPWLIKPGLELFILPVDGVYHTGRAGETVANIAATYEVELAALYNEWNGLEEGDQPREGQLLVVTGGMGEEVEWEPPPLYPSPGPAGYSYGICGGAGVTGPGGNGWFTLPTGSYGVSGWYFHDPRNPTHIGLDYRCRPGDPIYAADNGVVTIAGWHGGYGILVELNHGNGFVTRYAHFDSIAVGCGHTVYQGNLLGYCGNTGWSSGAHLHFEIRHNGVPQDPMAYQP
ncbi:MAG: peptidoglycan DD-metalloendopeptidase family protein [Chloroflexi bacterium]|nr:peptidoglycan DD-metalloendopeptidase family protein [Chloroflexota bacterium]